ncbi:hypothetical protein [Nonomuraea sp. NPDC003214]
MRYRLDPAAEAQAVRGNLNGALYEIELQLPVQPFGSEWQALLAGRTGPLRGRYADLGSTERIVPGVFVLLHLLLMAGGLLA